MQTSILLQYLGKYAESCLGARKLFSPGALSFMSIFQSLLGDSADVGLTDIEG